MGTGITSRSGIRRLLFVAGALWLGGGLALLILTSPLPGWLLALGLAGVLVYGGVVVGLARLR